MKLYVITLILFASLSTLTVAQALQPAEVSETAVAQGQPKETVPLKEVVDKVQVAIDDYQKNRGAGQDALPPLSSVECDFKVATGTTGGFSINFYIFKLGASVEKDVTNEITYTYSLPKPKSPAGIGLINKKPPQLEDQLATDIQSAAASVKQAATAAKLPFSKLIVNVQYGIKFDGNGGINVPIQLVTLGFNVDKNKNSVQSVKLTFGQ